MPTIPMNITPAMIRVARLISEGWRNPAIGRKLGISVDTVRAYIYRMKVELQVRPDECARVKIANWIREQDGARVL